MTKEKSVLVIGLDPKLIDFSQTGYAPGMDATKVLTGLKSSEDELANLGYRAQMCLMILGRLRRQCSKPTQAEAVRLHPYWSRCASEPKQLHAV